jgi:hypothetical protein
MLYTNPILNGLFGASLGGNVHASTFACHVFYNLLL